MLRKVQTAKLINEFGEEEIIKNAVINTELRLIISLDDEGNTKEIINFDFLRKVEILPRAKSHIKVL